MQNRQKRYGLCYQITRKPGKYTGMQLACVLGRGSIKGESSICSLPIEYTLLSFCFVSLLIVTSFFIIIMNFVVIVKTISSLLPTQLSDLHWRATQDRASLMPSLLSFFFRVFLSFTRQIQCSSRDVLPQTCYVIPQACDATAGCSAHKSKLEDLFHKDDRDTLVSRIYALLK